MSSTGAHNLARLAERAFERKGDYRSLLFEQRWHRSAELFDRAGRLAAGLTELGVSAGDRVVVTMANCPEVGIVYNALWRAGAVVTPATLLPTEELRHVIADSEACGVVTTPEFADKVRGAVAGLQSVRFVICTEEAGADLVALESVQAAQAAPIVPRADDDLAALLYTARPAAPRARCSPTPTCTSPAAPHAAHVPGIQLGAGHAAALALLRHPGDDRRAAQPRAEGRGAPALVRSAGVPDPDHRAPAPACGRGPIDAADPPAGAAGGP